MPHTPTPVVAFGQDSEQVAEAQRLLTRAGFPARPDGAYGPLTRAAVKAWRSATCTEGSPDGLTADDIAALQAAKPAQRETFTVPRLGAWFDRSGVLAPGRCIDLATGLLDDAFLFIEGTESPQLFATFPRLLDVAGDYRAAGVTPHWTLWNRRLDTAKDEARLRRIVEEADAAGIGLDFDGEHHLRGWTGAHVERFVSCVRGFRGCIGINDYAAMQSTTGAIIRGLVSEGLVVEARPQAYSVDRVSYLPPERQRTTPGSVYWPGTTQRFAMRPAYWGSVLESPRVGLGFGLAAYKQSWAGQPMTAARSIRTQVETARAYNPDRIIFWEGERLTGKTRATIAGMWGRA